LIKKVPSSEFIRFVLVGILNTLFGYSIFALLIFLQLNYAAALLLATIMGVFFNFKTIGKLVFKSSDNKLIFRFAGVYTVAYLLNLGLIFALSFWISNRYLEQAILAFPVALFSYYLNKRLVFAR